MDKSKIGNWALLLLFVAMFSVGMNDVNAYSAYTPVNCNYLLIGASNISDSGETQNQTFVAILSTTTNQTQRATGGTFVRLENQNGLTLFTNYTGVMANTSGETAIYSVGYAPTLDAQQTYKVSATFYFLNNSFVNYTATSAACDNRSFNVNSISGGYFVQQQAAQVASQQKSKNTNLLLIVAATVIVIYIVSQMKNKR